MNSDKYVVFFNGRCGSSDRLNVALKRARVRKDSVNYTATRNEGGSLVRIDRGGNLRVPRA